MVNLPSSLQSFVESLRVDARGDLCSADRRIGHAQSDPGQLTSTLAGAVYEHVYSRPFPCISEPPPARGLELTDVLEQANTTCARVEHDWVMLEPASDGGVIAVREGRSRRLMMGQFLALGGVLPLVAGAPLLAQLPRGSRTQQPGFYYCFSEGFVDANDLSPVVRMYFNVGVEGAAELIRMVTGALNRYEIPFHLKVTTRSADFVRTDNAVLYLTRACFHSAALALRPVVSVLERLLATDIPLFTKRLARGIGFAENPGVNDSFGSSRSKLVAAALVAARAGNDFPYAAFASHFGDVVSAAGLRMETLYLNPGSEDIYDLCLTPN